MRVRWNDIDYKVNQATVDFWPHAVWVLEELPADEATIDPEVRQSDNGLQLRFNAHGDVDSDGDLAQTQQWTFHSALQQIEDNPDDQLTPLLIDRLVYFFFLEPVNNDQE